MNAERPQDNVVRGAVRGVRSACRTALYRVARWVLARFGRDFELFPLVTAGAGTGDSGQSDAFYRSWSSPVVWAPWQGDAGFRAAYDGVQPHTVVSSERCYVIYTLVRQTAPVPGDAAECGVYQGGTALLQARALAPSGRKLMLFDSFEGLPAPDETLDPHFHQGTFRATSPESVARLLREHAESVEICPGWIPATFAGQEDRRFSFVHLDVDLYRSTLDCLDFFYPRLNPGGVLVFDDYGFPEASGEKAAVDEFFADRPEVPLVLPTGQAVVTKVAAGE